MHRAVIAEAAGLEARDEMLGIESLCVAGGPGPALLVERPA